MNAAKIFGTNDRAEWLRPSVIALILANLVPVFGVLFLGWEIFPLMFLFWLENVIVGVFNVLKMLCAAPEDVFTDIGKLFIIPFFCFHYGLFTFVHGMFIIGLFGGGFGHGKGGPPLHSLAQLWDLVQSLHLEWAVLGLFVSRAFSFVSNYLIGGEYRNATLSELMNAPYGRIVVLHLAIIGGGFLMMALGSPVWGLLLLVALKIVLDLRGHFRERQKFGGAAAAAE